MDMVQAIGGIQERISAAKIWCHSFVPATKCRD
jgi:hypothetical protein